MNDFLKGWRLPQFVKRYDVEMGEDSVGEPAVFVIFYVENDLSPSKEKLRELKELTDSVSKDLMVRVPQRWPYVRVREAA